MYWYSLSSSRWHKSFFNLNEVVSLSLSSKNQDPVVDNYVLHVINDLHSSPTINSSPVQLNSLPSIPLIGKLAWAIEFHLLRLFVRYHALWYAEKEREERERTKKRIKIFIRWAYRYIYIYACRNSFLPSSSNGSFFSFSRSSFGYFLFLSNCKSTSDLPVSRQFSTWLKYHFHRCAKWD